MTLLTLAALVSRDICVARRNLFATLLHTICQLLLFLVVFGHLLTANGIIGDDYKSLLLPGLIGLSMVVMGMISVALPLIADLSLTRELEDRLLAPVRVESLAAKKILIGLVQALLFGLLVSASSSLVLDRNVGITFVHPTAILAVPILITLFSAADGLTVDCTVGQAHAGVLLGIVIAPMIFFGCVYYPWSALARFPLMQTLLFLNPIFYASEGLRGAVTPNYSHLPLVVVLSVLLVLDSILMMYGLDRFKARVFP